MITPPLASNYQGYAQQVQPQTPPPTGNTSGALVFNIYQPTNYAGGAPAGAGPVADTFNRGAAAPAATTPINPFASPQEQLTQAYNNAVNARNAAEAARNQYLQLGNQLNSGAYQNQFGNPFGNPAGMAAPGTLPPGMMDPQAAALAQQQQAAALAQQQAQQAALAQQQYEQMLQQQQQQALAQQQAAAEQAAQQQQPQPEPGLASATVEELNRMIAQPQTMQEKVDAMQELGARGQATPESYELLKQEALADTSALPAGSQAQSDANYVRQAALWTMGMLNQAQNSQVPASQLPGLSAIKQIITNKNESPDVKAAAVQALQVMERPQDKEIKKLLKKASRDKNPDVKRLAKEALSGKPIALPTQEGAAA